MDLSQKKLTKEEWETLEIPLPTNELKILKMIHSSYKNVNYFSNDTISLLKFMKVVNDIEMYHNYFYELYFKPLVGKIQKKYKINITVSLPKRQKKLKKRDEIKIKNMQKKLGEIKKNIYEFILLNNFEKYLESRKDEKIHLYYTLCNLLKNHITNVNAYVVKFIKDVLESHSEKMEKMKSKLIEHSEVYIEKNHLINMYNNLSLHDHQKQLFTLCKSKNPKCILYQAPTGMGKTISPIGLVNQYKIIFVCAAKHIGLQLAKACISMEIPIAVAFGCEDASDIRLHYFAAKDIIRNRRTGGIYRVDNSVGDKVEVIISDIQSYLYAMNYMKAFNKVEDILWYWDEPTITLDYETHEFHDILKENWTKNVIPNVILSSATLPNKEEIMPMVYGFKNKYENCEIHEIKSYDCKKTISLVDSKGYVVMPHILADNNRKKLKKYAKYIKENKTLLRHVDVKEMSRFVCFLNDNELIKPVYNIDNYFECIQDIDIISIKLYYLKLISTLKDIPDKLWETYKKNTEKEYRSNIKITTSDSYTLTDGPTIFLTENVEKLALFYLKASNIPQSELNDMLKVIQENEIYKNELNKIMFEERERQDKLDAVKSDKVDKVDSGNYQKLEQFDAKVSMLKSKIKKISLKKIYVPNTDKHLDYNNTIDIMNEIEKSRMKRAFKGDIEEETIEEIMTLDVRDEWKILLLMGIGVFVEHKCKQYRDIMKKLAQEQKLYLILASSDFIYGTNYQFCHGYLAKDLENMTQEKMLQAFGRVGRRNNQLEYTLRIRDDKLIDKLYKPERDKMETINMNELFG